jgi:hypothetical protein
MARIREGRTLVYSITASIMIVGPLNFLLFRILYDSFGAKYAFFVSQGVNAFYVIVGGAVLYPRMWYFSSDRFLQPCYNEISRDMRALPQGRFMQMAVLDCLGTFLAAMGAVSTPGQVQTLLNQALIPCTMTASVFFLHASYSKSQYSGGECTD